MTELIPASLDALSGLWQHPVIAYIDPGSGSAIMGAIIGFFVALGLAVKTYWYKLKSIFSPKSANKEIGDESSN